MESILFTKNMFTIESNIDPTNSFVAIRNMIILGSTHCIMFVCYFGTRIFATSVNDKLGFISLGILYGTFGFSNFFTPIVFKKLGFKISFIVGGITYALWIGSNVVANPYLIIISSIILGIGSSLSTVTQGTFVVENSGSGTDSINYLSSIYLSIFQLSNIICYLISGTLLYINFSFTSIFTVFAIISSVAPLGFLLLNTTICVQSKKSISVKDIFLRFRDRRVLLIIPLFAYMGVIDSWITGSFTLLMDVHMIPFVMICFGGISSGWIFISGRLSNISQYSKFLTPKHYLIFASVNMIIALYVTCMFVYVYPEQLWLLYCGAVLYGLTDGSIRSQMYKIIKMNFPSDIESSIGVCRFFQHISVMICMLLNTHITVSYFVIVLSLLSLISLTTVIIALRIDSKVMVTI